MKKFYRLLSIVLALVMIFALAACSKSQSENNGSESVKSTEAPKAADPFAPYSPPIEITTVRSVGQWKYAEGDTVDNNVWYRAYEKDLGIKLKNIWTVAEDQYDQKLNIAIASQDLPDVLDVNEVNFKKLLDNDMLADLTEVYDGYASTLTKEIMMQDGGAGLGTATFGGKLMAIPETNSISDNILMLWIRTDWLQNLNLAAPKTLDDVMKIAEAFTKQDPDGNGKDDTYGLAVSKELYVSANSWLGSVDGIFNACHAAPTAWIKDDSGNLVYGGIQPEMKLGLAKVREMFKAGLIDPEFGVKDATKIGDDCNAGKLGMAYGVMWVPGWPLQAGKDSNPAVAWKPFQIVSADGNLAKPVVGSPVKTWHVVTKSCKNPEAAVKFTNEWVDKSYGSNADPDNYSISPDGLELFKLCLNRVWPATKNIDAHLAVVDALKTNDPSKLDPEQKGYYDKIVSYNNGDNKNWGTAMIFGPEGSQSICNAVNKNKDWIFDEFYGAPLPSMQDKKTTLDKMRDETVLRIIMGEAPVDDFDNYVAQWKSLGGDQITADVNAWYKEKNSN